MLQNASYNSSSSKCCRFKRFQSSSSSKCCRVLAMAVRGFKSSSSSKCSVLAIAVRGFKSSSSSKCRVIAIAVGGFKSSSSSRCCRVLARAVRRFKRARRASLRGEVLEHLCVFLIAYRF